MRSPVEAAVDRYIRAWSERDPLARSSLLEACFAAEGRIVQRSGETRGRAALAVMIESFIADPRWLRVRITSAVDAVGTTFRFRASIDRQDGTSLDLFDAGEIDETGRIALILTFVDPLAEARQSGR
jgi:SnoaL-like protein